MASPQDQAQVLVQTLEATPEYQELKKVQEEIEKNETLNKMLNQYRSIQVEIQTMHLQGRQPSDEVEQKVNQLTQMIEGIPLLKQYLDAEQKFGEIFQEVQQIVMQPVLELYQGIGEEAQDGTSDA